jgi:MFS transporter, PAT family, beta-lactamase induction signal transducer AmpG
MSDTAHLTRGARSPIRWVPTLYFVQGLQFFVVMLIAGLMFKRMGVPNDAIGNWTATLGLAWALKPLWSPFLEQLRSKKVIVSAMQFTGAALLALTALALQLPMWFGATLGVLFILAYTSATHDVACDGLYMASLDARAQAQYVGWQGAFFNASKFLTLGGLMKLAGLLEGGLGVFRAWSVIFGLLAVGLALLAAWNWHALPNPLSPPAPRVEGSRAAAVWQTQREVFVALLRKPGIWLAIGFIVLFRLGEGQVQTIGPLFLLEPRAQGGLGLSSGQVGDIYGVAGTAAFLIGSILGGYFAAWAGLRRAMAVHILAMVVPNIVFYYLSLARPEDLWHIAAAVSVESFFYGFGFVGMILFIMQAVAPGRFQTAHYALGSGVMQLGFIFAKFVSGNVEVQLGYPSFFAWTIACGLPPLLLLWFLRWPAAANDDGRPPV